MRHFATSTNGTTTVVNHVQALRPVRTMVVNSSGETVPVIQLKPVTIGYAKS